MQSYNLFVYGTLQCDAVVQRVISRVPESAPATIHGFKRYCLRGVSYPGIMRHEEGSVQGRVLYGITAEEIRVFDFFEGDAYFRTNVEAILADGSSCRCETYLWLEESQTVDQEWSLDQFQAARLKTFLRGDFEEELKDIDHSTANEPQSPTLGAAASSPAAAPPPASPLSGSEPRTHDLFVCGSLLCKEVVQSVLGHIPESVAATIHGFRRYRVFGVSYPGLMVHPKYEVTGRILKGLSSREIDILDHFEGTEYSRVQVEAVLADGSIHRCQTFLFLNASRVLDEDWNLEEFQKLGARTLLGETA